DRTFAGPVYATLSVNYAAWVYVFRSTSSFDAARPLWLQPTASMANDGWYTPVAPRVQANPRGASATTPQYTADALKVAARSTFTLGGPMYGVNSSVPPPADMY